MDDKDFFAQQETTAQDIRQQLEKGHGVQIKTTPPSTAEKCRVDESVLLLTPCPMDTHCTKTWFTSAEVVCRTAEDTYCVNAGTRQFREWHECQLRAPEPDIDGKHMFLDYTAHEAESDHNYAEQDDCTVEKIPAHCLRELASGGIAFKVGWRGYGPSHDAWEPVSSFVPRNNTPFIDYLRRHRTKLQVSDLEGLMQAIHPLVNWSPPLALSRMGRLSGSLSNCQNVPCLLALSQFWCNVFAVASLKCRASRATPYLGGLIQPLRVALTLA